MKRTPWFGMGQKPVREGEYEGREVGSGMTIVVYWRTLEDTGAPGWYFDKGYWGPFHMWESATKHMTAWRGLAEEAK